VSLGRRTGISYKEHVSLSLGYVVFFVSPVNDKPAVKFMHGTHHTELYTKLTSLSYTLLHARVLLEKLTGSAASQEIPPIFWNPKVHHRTHKCPPTVPVLSQQATKAQRWSRHSSTLSLTSALDRVGGQYYAPVALPSGQTRYLMYRKVGRLRGS